MLNNITKALIIGTSITLISLSPTWAGDEHDMMRSITVRGTQFVAHHDTGINLEERDIHKAGRGLKRFFSRLFNPDKKESRSGSSSPCTMRRCDSPASMDVMFTDVTDDHTATKRPRRYSNELVVSKHTQGPKPRTSGARIDAFGYHGLSYRGIRRLLAERVVHNGKGWISAVQSDDNGFYDVSKELKQSLRQNPYRHLTKFYLEGDVLQVSVPHPSLQGPSKVYSLVVLETNSQEAHVLQGLKRWAEVGNSGYGVTDKINLGNGIAKIQAGNLTKIAQSIDKQTISLRLIDSNRYTVSTYDPNGHIRDLAIITLQNRASHV